MLSLLRCCWLLSFCWLSLSLLLAFLLLFGLKEHPATWAVRLVQLLNLGPAPVHQALLVEMMLALRGLCHPVVFVAFICIFEFVDANTASVRDMSFVFDLTVLLDIELRLNPFDNPFLGLLNPLSLSLRLRLLLFFSLSDRGRHLRVHSLGVRKLFS